MIFLALLIAVSIWNFSTKASAVQYDGWLLVLHKRLSQFFPATTALVLSIALPVTLVAVLMLFIERKFFDVFTLIVSVLFILYGFGRGDMRPGWFTYLNEWQRGDYEAAYRQATEMGAVTDQAIEEPFALHDVMRRTFCSYSLERFFAPVFWFVVLGPAAIVAYRLVVIVNQWRGDNDLVAHQLSTRWRQWLEYLPARLLALTFTLAGNFSSGFNYIRDRFFNHDSASHIVAGSAMASLELPADMAGYDSQVNFINSSTQELLEIKNLLKRSQLVWMLALGFMLLI